MLPHDPLHLYRLHEEQLVREAEARRRQREHLQQRAHQRRLEREAARAERRAARAGRRAGRALLTLLLPARRG
ncbi:hypothetical protein AB3M89_15650 [Microbacterium sp. 179-I 3D2 NHS]|uniref:hypothetical protein n=1 Tax=Microbacterium sp. 179-I 3D2 NHS TaxID=3235178 RepID=UPI0039A0F81D